MASVPPTSSGTPETSAFPESYGSNLGSLTQSARSSELKSARGILIAVGILTLGANLVFLAMTESMVNDAIAKEVADVERQGMVIDPAALAEAKQQAIRTTQLVNGLAAGLGGVFIVLGIIVYQAPVFATVCGLVLYVGAVAMFGMLDPLTLMKGIIIKIIIVAGLFKAVQAALAYQREQKSLEAAMFSMPR